jgi:hypothetical protein
METPLTDAVADYVKFASPLLKEWQEHATGVASKLDAGEYNADKLAADLAKCTKLAIETGVGAVMEVLDVMAILTGSQYERITDEHVFSTSLPGAALELAGPLISGSGLDQLSPDDIKILPSPQLGPGATEFRLRADVTGHRGGLYTGTVVASKLGAPDDEVIVFLQV